MNDDLIAKNPVPHLSGRRRTPPGAALRHHVRAAAVAQAVPERYGAMVVAAGLGGLRQGELFALRWDDVDLAAATITVRRKRRRLASGEVIEDDPKSRAGRRTVALPGRARRRAASPPHGHATGLGGYVFTSVEGRPIERSNFRQRVWLPAAKAAGLAGLRFHDLRHTAGTLAARTGATNLI
ncbi:MAG: tyrosine-type recombinase/integrase [Actinomycetota bacterium]|nr:tyrosine-type recombinase/integrase [Actinomycetota bacterium]